MLILCQKSTLRRPLTHPRRSSSVGGSEKLNGHDNSPQINTHKPQWRKSQKPQALPTTGNVMQCNPRLDGKLLACPFHAAILLFPDPVPSSLPYRLRDLGFIMGNWKSASIRHARRPMAARHCFSKMRKIDWFEVMIV